MHIIIPLIVYIYILIVNSAYIYPALQLIVSAAFTPDALGGGMIGGGVMIAARYGIARGLFSNESGLGSAPLVAAAAKTKNPVRQALVTSTPSSVTFSTNHS